MSNDEICYIHKMAYIKTERKEELPYAGVIKLTTYRCPLCASSIEGIEYEREEQKT